MLIGLYQDHTEWEHWSRKPKVSKYVTTSALFQNPILLFLHIFKFTSDAFKEAQFTPSWKQITSFSLLSQPMSSHAIFFCTDISPPVFILSTWECLTKYLCPHGPIANTQKGAPDNQEVIKTQQSTWGKKKKNTFWACVVSSFLFCGREAVSWNHK